MKTSLFQVWPALVLAPFFGACQERLTALARPNVVLICLDTVRADHLGTYGYSRPTTPALDALAQGSIVFERASATAGWTKPSVPSFLTGTYPLQHGVYEGSARGASGEITDVLPDEALTLAEVFQQEGYRTAAFVHNAQLRPGNGFEQGFDLYAQENMDAREIRWRGLDWIDASSEGPFFLYLHFLDAHWPYPAPDEWVTRFAPAEDTARFRGKDSKALYEAINDGEHQLTAEDRASLVALYDGALAYLDHEVGRFLDGLELRGLAEDTVVCVVADHGEEFGEHGKVGHGHGLWEDLLHVPWILRVPGQDPRRIATSISLVDLFPTLLLAAGIAPPAGHEGIDRLAEPTVERPIFAEHKAPGAYSQTLRVGSQKLLRRFTAPRGGGTQELVLPIGPGTRWEAEMERVNGEYLATELKPRDEDIDDPPELKGPIETLGDSELSIAGIRVVFGPETVRQTEAGTSGPDLAPGQVVKVRGPVVDGELRAERIRFYAPNENPQLEIRATVDSIEQAGGAGRLTLGGFELRFTPATGLKDAERRMAKRHLSRSTLVQLVESGAGPGAAAAAFESERESYDLARDPDELSPGPTEPGSPLDTALDELGATLVRKRLFGERDQRLLDASAIRELQDIGYAGDE